jgi:serine/threonine protein kinase
MGTVWEGVHVKLGTRVAIKFIRPQFAQQPEARARFEIEARAAAKLQTKHACHVYDYGVSDEGLPYIVMEYLDGESLSKSSSAAACCRPSRWRTSSDRPRARSTRRTRTASFTAT